jgi:hypothetical protein
MLLIEKRFKIHNLRFQILEFKIEKNLFFVSKLTSVKMNILK